MLMFKQGVRVEKLTPQCVLAMMVADGLWGDYGAAHCVVTSVRDGRHGAAGKHPDGDAFDLRTKTISEAGKERRVLLQELRTELSARLPEGYDVIAEAIGSDNEHIHVEYDPK